MKYLFVYYGGKWLPLRQNKKSMDAWMAWFGKQVRRLWMRNPTMLANLYMGWYQKHYR